MKSVDTKRDSTSSKQFELLQENVENENYLIEHTSNDSINHNKKKRSSNTIQNKISYNRGDTIVKNVFGNTISKSTN